MPTSTRPLVLLMLPLALSCKFDPHVPDGVVTCTDDSQCPAGLGCSRATGQATGLCCRGATCQAPAGDRPSAVDAAGPATPGDAAAEPGFGGGDAEISRPPVVPVGPPANGGDAGPAETGLADAGTTAALTCSPGADVPPTPAPDRQTHCTLSVGDRWLTLGIDVVTANDPISTRAHAVCWTEPRLLATTSEPGAAAARPLPPAALDELVATIRQLQARCTTLQGQLVGAVAGGWARRVPNQAAIVERLRQDTGVTLDIPSEVQELAYRYLGATRNRRGRIVFSDWASQADVLFWPPSATAPTRHIVPVSFEEASAQYFGSTSYAMFEDARRALRQRLQTELAPLTQELARLIGSGTVHPGVTIGPTDPTVLLALKGGLRDPVRGWDPPEVYRRKREEATVITSPYGRAYGLILPPDLDAFFLTITARDFTQLRAEPIRSAYGGHVMLTTTLLDLISDEGRANEFAFVFTNAHFGYLFSKLGMRNP